MDHLLFQNLKPAQRIQTLEDNCDSIEQDYMYVKDLTPDELQGLEAEFATLAVKLNAIEEEKAQAMEEFKLRMKPLKADLSAKLSMLKTRTIQTAETCYLFKDHEKAMIYIYNGQGEQVASRRMLPGERQISIKNWNSKTGTED